MSIELIKEQNDYIDRILSKGLDEIKTIPSYHSTIISNNSNTIKNDINYIDNINNNLMNKNKLNLIIPTANDYNIPSDINKGNNNKNIFLKNNIEEEKNEIFFDPMNKNAFYNSLNINQKRNEENKYNLMMSNNFPNKNAIIDIALRNNHKNINKLNKYITGNSLSSSHSNCNNKKADLSSSTRNLIDKYLDIKSSICSKRSSKLDKNDSLYNEFQDNLFRKSNNSNLMSSNNNDKNNDIMDVHESSCNSNKGENNNMKNKKYNPRSSALKKLIEKLKKENEYEESTNNNYNSSIQISSFCDSGLFTLGNSNGTSLTSLKEKITKKNKEKKKKNKYRLNSEIIKKKNIRTFDKILDSSANLNKNNSEINIFRNRIKRKSTSGHIKIKPYLKKNYSMKSLLKPNLEKNQLFKISSGSMENISMIKNIKRKSKSIKINNKYIKKTENEYMIKYKELRKKFDIQREKMKQEKNSLIILHQKINFFKKKLEKYSQLVEFNKTLNKQNYILLNNLNISDDSRNKQAKLIELLQNQIKKLKKL